MPNEVIAGLSQAEKAVIIETIKLELQAAKMAAMDSMLACDLESNTYALQCAKYKGAVYGLQEALHIVVDIFTKEG